MLMLFLGIGFGFLFLSTVVTSAKSPTFSGRWKLQTNSSLVPPDFLAMNVSQNNSELKVELRKGLEANGANPGDDIQVRLYDLGGKETLMYEDDDSQKVAATLTAALQPDGKLVLEMNRFMTDKNEKFTLKRKSVWELLSDGRLEVTEFLELPGTETKSLEPITLHYVKDN